MSNNGLGGSIVILLPEHLDPNLKVNLIPFLFVIVFVYGRINCVTTLRLIKFFTEAYPDHSYSTVSEMATVN